MIPFGVTFYPDQWPKEYWDKAFSQIAAAGFNVVRFGEMAWNWVEKSEGNFDFSEMKLAMDTAEKYKIKVILGIATSQAPSWLIKKYPEVRPVADDGTTYPEYGPRPNICRDSSTYKELAEKYIRNIVKHFKDHPALDFWQIDNEPVYPPLDHTTSKDFCHCGFSKEKFIAWAEKKYANIDNLNTLWGTRFWTVQFSSFADISTPKCGIWDAGNPHIFIDWFRFKSDQLGDWLKWEKSVVSNIDSSHKIGTNGFIGVPSRVPDHSILAQNMDWYGLDIYPKGNKLTPNELAAHADLWRSFAWGAGAQFHVTEMQGGPNVRWGNPSYVTGDEIRIWTHQMIAHGAQAILYHNWRTPLFGSETGGFGILNIDGSRSERLTSIEKTGKEINDIINKLKGYKLESDVAICYMRSSEVQTYQEQGPPRTIAGQWEDPSVEIGLMYGLNSIAGAHRIIWDLFNPCDFIFETLDNLHRYKVILLPNPYLLSKKQADSLTEFVKKGGVLITEARFGLKNEFAHLYEKPLMEDILGVKYDHTTPAEKKLKLNKFGTKVHGFRDYINAANNGVIAKFSDGKPAIIEKIIGKGRFVYFAFSLFITLGSGSTYSESLMKFVRGYLPNPDVQTKCNENVEVSLWKGKKNNLLYIINHSNKPQVLNVIKPKKLKINLKSNEVKTISVGRSED